MSDDSFFVSDLAAASRSKTACGMSILVHAPRRDGNLGWTLTRRYPDYCRGSAGLTPTISFSAQLVVAFAGLARLSPRLPVGKYRLRGLETVMEAAEQAAPTTDGARTVGLDDEEGVRRI